jgi:hypothetical protein
MITHTFRPRSEKSYAQIWVSLRQEHFYESVRMAPMPLDAAGPTIELVNPKPSVSYPKHILLRPRWARIVFQEYADADELSNAWWRFARRFAKHLVVLRTQAGSHETSEFLRWLTDPENMP